VHPVGSYCTDISRCTVSKTLNSDPLYWAAWRWHFGAETCRSQYLWWIRLYDFYFFDILL